MFFDARLKSEVKTLLIIEYNLKRLASLHKGGLCG